MQTIAISLAQAMSEYGGTLAGSPGGAGGGAGGSFQMPEISMTAWLVIGGVLVGMYLFTRFS